MKKLRNAIRNWIISRVMKHYGYEIINKWVYFTFNYPYSAEHEFIEMYGENIGKHFYSKFTGIYDSCGSRAVIHTLWCDMSDHYRQTLMDKWFIERYVNDSSSKWLKA